MIVVLYTQYRVINFWLKSKCVIEKIKKVKVIKGALSGLRQFSANESPFRSKDIYVFVSIFWSCSKTA